MAKRCEQQRVTDDHRFSPPPGYWGPVSSLLHDLICCGYGVCQIFSIGPSMQEHDRHRFRGGHFASLGIVPQGHERIGLGVVSGGAAHRYVIGDNLKRACLAANCRFHSCTQANPAPRHEAQADDIVAVEEHHFARALYAPEAIVLTVHGGVELVIAAQRHQLQDITAGFARQHVVVFIQRAWGNELRLP